MFSSWSIGLFLFVLRIADVSFSTLRLMMVLRGRRLAAWITAFASALVFVLGARQVFSGAQDPIKLLGYAGGFATGVMVGMWLEERIAVGTTRFEVISPRRGALLMEELRRKGFAVTEIAAHGKDGAVTLLHCSVTRRRSSEVQQIILVNDPDAFVVAQDLRPLQRGYWSA